MLPYSLGSGFRVLGGRKSSTLYASANFLTRHLCMKHPKSLGCRLPKSVRGGVSGFGSGLLAILIHPGVWILDRSLTKQNRAKA